MLVFFFPHTHLFLETFAYLRFSVVVVERFSFFDVYGKTMIRIRLQKEGPTFYKQFFVYIFNEIDVIIAIGMFPFARRFFLYQKAHHPFN